MKKNKFKEITLMNAFLCLCVVMIHLTSAPVSALSYGSFWHILIFIVNRALCFSVPAFIFLSGFKLHNKYGDSNINLKTFFGGRFKKIVIPYIFCVMVYFVYFFAKGWVRVKDLPQYVFLGTLTAHFYYIVIAVQSYLIFPVVKNIFNKYPKLVTGISLLCTVCCLEFLRFSYTDRFIGTYIFFFVLGMLFSKYKLYDKINKIMIVSVTGFALVGIVHLSLLYRLLSGAAIYRYAETVNVAYVTLAIIVIYSACIKLKDMCIFNGAQVISHSSYNIYLYHIMIMQILQYDVFPRFSLSIKGQFTISFTVVYSLIFIYSWLINRRKTSGNKTMDISDQQIKG